MIRFRAIVAAAFVTVLLSGCSAGGGAPSAPTPTSTLEASTVQQWASLIAQERASWNDWEVDWNDHECSGIYAASSAGVLCTLSLTSAMYMTQTTSTEFEIATTKGTDGYIAPAPPAEIGDLWDRTVRVASAAEDASTAWNDAGCSLKPTADLCVSPAVTFERAIDDLRSQFSAWEPYL